MTKMIVPTVSASLSVIGFILFSLVGVDSDASLIVQCCAMEDSNLRLADIGLVITYCVQLSSRTVVLPCQTALTTKLMARRCFDSPAPLGFIYCIRIVFAVNFFFIHCIFN